MRFPSRLFLALALIAFPASVVATAGPALAASASIEQVRNGPADATTTPVPGWATGNAGASNSHYLESHSTAYRAVLDGLPTDGTVIEMVIGYDVKRSGSYALDYLTQFQRVLPHVLFGHREPEVFDPLAGVTGVGAGITTAPIPLPSSNLLVDPDGADPEPAALQPRASMAALPDSERVMTLYGGTLLDVTYVSEADVALATGSSESQVRVRFTASSPKAVLAWGGHIACRWDWGFNPDGSPRSAAGISGSSYHMRLVGWNLGSIGSQDRSMSTDAVFPVPRCGISNLGPFCAGSTNTHSAPTGMESYAWTLFDNTSGATFVGDSTGLSVTVRAGTAGGYGLLLTTGASGFTRQCQGTFVVTAPAAVSAGPDRVACESSPQAQLAGSVAGGTAAWTGGTGTFAPGRSDPAATYTLSAAEVTAGSVTLTLVGTPSGPCPASSDAVTITVQRSATANAGPDLASCASSPQVQLAGSVGNGATSGTWSGGAGTFGPGPTALNALYTPSAAEIAAGGVTLTLTSDDPAGPCPAVSDAVRITILPAATAGAGPDQALCAGAPAVHLAGSVGGAATGGTWSGGTGTFSPNASALTATYTPSAAEVTAGHVTLTLTTNDPAGACPAVSDAMTVSFSPITVVSAGPDQDACSSSPQVQLHGTVSGTVSTGTWSGGTGLFTPGRGALDATYLPSAAEIAAGSVTLALTSDASSGPCPSASDTVRVAIHPAVVVSAGPDQAVCAGTTQVQLAGSVAGAPIRWWTGGRGGFWPTESSPSPLYRPTPFEVAAGQVRLRLVSVDPPGPCGPDSDEVVIRFDAPTVTVPNRVVCTGIGTATLCAQPGRGTPPFTYRWSTGATTPCIAVSDTGAYSVTITDALGCEGSGAGAFRRRECVGQLAHTATTCATFMAGTGEDFSEVSLVVKNDVITSIAPGVFFYFTKITAPRPDFTVNLVQVRDNASYPFCEVQQGQITLYDSDCGTVGDGVVTGPGQGAVEIRGATVGQVFLISVKYSLKMLVGVRLDPSAGVHYDFRTEIDGQVVDSDPDGLQIGTRAVAGVDDPVPGLGALALYRPAPNPFRDQTRIGYAVGVDGERVAIGVYDLAGRRVRTLADGSQSAGPHVITWDGRDDQGARVRVGLYFVQVRVGDRGRDLRVTFLK